ncbi:MULTISPECIES: LPXTG cell wall anchor domain-containing protein [Micromonospora]|uniref:LPXTG-motif cell wall anchor domain-containing protein n=1 Tax=Micromonospora yangpuensis TaxID=683228 RepID=A0A1C6VCT8_9ACTN|nr:LPXTG cell wall anchor domain-containing protein [Micromonospora yangpuensis]GGM13217.1 hypothetical protein GCM10012279_34220 [Micromonospora yangpuensis]SCL64085.1 LPXTG-motif cell wall anchor domain-containing protein [Micromonospora yangpuensis]
MSANQDLPLTGASTAAAGLLGALLLGVGALLVTVAKWGAKTRRRSS